MGCVPFFFLTPDTKQCFGELSRVKGRPFLLVTNSNLRNHKPRTAFHSW